MTVNHYRVELDAERGLVPSMQWLADVIGDAIEKRGGNEGQYELTVHGPPELRIGVRR